MSRLRYNPFQFRGWIGTVGVLVLGVLLVVGACDGGGSKQVAQYERLVGTWRVEDLMLDGSPVRVHRDVQLTFDADDGRAYRLVSVGEDTTVVQGPVELLESNVLSMTDGFSRPVVWCYTFEEPDEFRHTVRFELQYTGDGSDQEVLDVLGVSGGADRLQIDLIDPTRG